MGYFICLMIGTAIGFMAYAIISQGKNADEQEKMIKYYNNLLEAQCLICPFRSEESRED